MKRIVSLAFLAALAISLLCRGTALAAELTPSAADAKPADLVAAALRTELEGRTDQRQVLLEAALRQDPEYAPARWQLGFVRWNDQWLTPEQVTKEVAGDKTLADYRQRRDALVDTAEANRELARWCRKNRLSDEERVHWAKALEFNPQDGEALEALGLQLYDGRLLTKDQIAEAKRQAGERLRAMKHWQPQLVKWRKAIESGSDRERHRALAELQTLDDPAAIPALEATLAENVAAEKTDRLNLALIATVSRMRVPEATQVLLRRALQPDSPSVRTAACDELKKRPMFTYVPQLIAAMPGAIKTKFHIYVLPNGMVLHEHEVLMEGQKADVSLRYESTVNPADLAAAVLLVTPRAIRQELEKSNLIETRSAATSAQLDWLRGRVSFALERTTGFDRPDHPELWEQQYNDYYGWYRRRESKPTYKYSTSDSASYYSMPTDSSTLLTSTNIHSCFPAGTTIQTQLGKKPIEQLRPGDRALSQDVTTGCLVYVPVQTTTLRQPTPLLEIKLDSGSITATPGHPFWVVGEGWRTAKKLNVGTALHNLHGPSYVREIVKVAPTEVYNLVLSGFHNYFVGESELLVHDNSPLEETTVLIPGLAAQIESR